MPECGEKIRHPTRDDALAHIKRLVWKNHSAGQSERSVGLAAYPCEHCQMWHVGHQRSTPLVWHYTVVRLLDPILESDALRPPAPRLVFDVNRVPPEVRRRYPDGCLPLSRSFVSRARAQRLPRVLEVPVPGTHADSRRSSSRAPARITSCVSLLDRPHDYLRTSASRQGRHVQWESVPPG